MFFRQLFDKESSTLTYVIADLKSSEAAIIDPVKSEIETYITLLAEYGLSLKFSLETHVHADHITASGLLRQRLNCQTGVSQACDAKLADIQIRECDKFRLGDNEAITAIATPGHTAGSMSFIWRDKLFTGDSLLINGCGRTDFQGGDAGTLYDSITQKLFSLPDETLVYPGHDYKGFRVSSILQEKQLNPRLSTNSREEFITMMNNLDLPKPRLIDIAVPANRYCGIDEDDAIQASDVNLSINTGRLLTSNQLVAQIKTEISEITPSDVESMLNQDDVILIDIREPNEYEESAIPNAHFLPRGVLEFKILELEKVLNPQNKIILYCRSGNRSALAAASLTKMGFRNVLSMSGGYEAWKESNPAL
ncbi:Hydroxyacylglutathione hydrolase [Methylophaga thiooxydans]|uniref:Hydroxyacylglutathione hydrolase n=1 Tax=Methylophaga thiooxydans TaxID=392484 RepID=A0A0A0BCS3_9GAMM|nr:MBL fold metallo-hydrolase [Methylophaga thiooxydans]KGM06373.1 Hydroxyacylglutathione hydrolase [Methylophaga thiooxydans]